MEYKPFQIDDLWNEKSYNQGVDLVSGDGHWRISDLLKVIEESNLPVFDFPLELINLSAQSFETNDLYEFLQHCQHVNKCTLDNPIIISHKGQILDGRHRICKAILQGETFIKAVRFPDIVRPTK